MGILNYYNNRFETFYDTEYFKVKEAISKNEFIKKAVNILKEKRYKVVIATNPLFPLRTIAHRIRWTGFEPSDFECISHFEKTTAANLKFNFMKKFLKVLNFISGELKKLVESYMYR